MRKRIVIMIFTALLLVGLVGTFAGPQIAEAASVRWNSCPHGEVNCAYPGQCHDYTDTNSDNICDRSQSAPQTTSSAAASSTTQSASGTASSSTAADTTAATVSSGVIAVVPSAATQTAAGSGSSSSNSSSTENPETADLKSSYYFLPIFLSLAVLYAFTWILSARKVITNMLHRRIWNLVLLASTVVSALLGLLLILRIDFNLNITLPFDMLFWHVEAGIALGLVAVFHILWHWRYFTKLFKTAS